MTLDQCVAQLIELSQSAEPLSEIARHAEIAVTEYLDSQRGAPGGPKENLRILRQRFTENQGSFTTAGDAIVTMLEGRLP